jgi:predicted phosphodiesterase
MAKRYFPSEQKLWTEKDISYLKKNYPSMLMDDLMKNLNRSLSSIEKKACRLRLKKDSNDNSSLQSIIDREKKSSCKQSTERFLKELVKEKASTELVVEILKEIIPAADFKPKQYNPVIDKNKKEEVAQLLLSDSHFGRYSAITLENKINELYEGIIKVVEIHRTAYPINELYINMLGDILDGDEIYPGQTYDQKFHLMEQMFTYGLPKLTNFFNQLSNHFTKITINCVPGNHGRKSKETDKRLNFDTIFYEALKLATVNNKKIVWNITWDWYQIIKIYKYNFLLTHGANIKTWLNIPVYGILQKGMRWQGSLPERWDYLLMGHFHTTWNFAWNNFEVYMNGTWMDNDRFALEQLGMDSVSKQYLLGVNEKRGITWSYKIDLNS